MKSVHTNWACVRTTSYDNHGACLWQTLVAKTHNLAKVVFLLLCYCLPTQTLQANEITIASNSLRLGENQGQFQLNATLTRDNESSEAITLNYQTQFPITGTPAATANVDYVSSNSSFTWQANDSSTKTISIVIKDDSTAEPNEQFELLLTTTDATTINSRSSERFILTIEDNDGIALALTKNTPDAATAQTLNVFCPELQTNSDNLTTDQQTLHDTCQAFENASDSEARQTLQALSPDSAGSQNALGQRLSDQQLKSIGNRLITLRQGAVKNHLTGLQLVVNGEQFPSDMVNYLGNRLAQSETIRQFFSDLLNKPIEFFATGTLEMGDKKSTENESGYKPHSYNLTLGADYKINSQWVAGAAFGIANTDANIANDAGDLEVQGYNLAIYGSYYQQALYIDGAINFGMADHEMTRHIHFRLASVGTDNHAHSNTDSNQIGLSLNIGHNWQLRDNISLDAWGRLDYFNASIDGYQESGAKGYNVAINSQTDNQFHSGVGTRVSQPINSQYGVLMPYASIEWIHNYRNNAHTVSGYFISDPLATQFSFDADQPDRNYFDFRIGTSMIFPHGITAFTEYAKRLQQANYDAYSFSIGIRMENVL